MKVLLFCPTYELPDGELAIRAETRESIDNLVAPEGVELVKVISNNNPNPLTGVRKVDHENTLYQYRLARQQVLKEGFDALLTVEHDMVIPPDALVKLLDTDADVAYGLYLFRQGKPALNCLRVTSSRRWIDMTITYFPDLVEKGKQQGWLECSGAGLGCTLIHRRVLEKVDFRRTEQGGHPAPDMPLAEDCVRNGFKQVCRFDVICGHIKPDGKVLVPFGEGSTMENVKIYTARSFNANIGGKTIHFKEGQEYTMPEDVVDDYVRAGYVLYVDDEPAIKIVGNKAKTKVKAVK